MSRKAHFLLRTLLRLFHVLAACAGISVLANETNVFRQAGVPSPDREWRGFDYTLAAKVFTSGKVPKPRFANPEGKILLDRLTSTNNFGLYLNKSLPVQARLADWQAIVGGANAVFKLYIPDLMKGKNVDSEVAAFMAFLLYTSEVGFDLIDEYKLQMEKDDNYQAQMERFTQVNSIAVNQFVGASTVLTEDYIPYDRHVVLSAMASTLPRFKKMFPSSYVAELKQKLIDARPKITEPENAREIDSMLQTLGN